LYITAIAIPESVTNPHSQKCDDIRFLD
jgi:hypothetical protein